MKSGALLIGSIAALFFSQAAARAQLPNFGSWSVTASGSGGIPYPGYSINEPHTGIGAPNGKVNVLLNSNPPFTGAADVEATLGDPFELQMTDLDETRTLQSLHLLTRTQTNFGMPIQLDAIVHFSVTDPVLMILNIPFILNNTPFTTVTAPATFNWPSFQGIDNNFSSYHLLPVGNYTFTSHANGTQAGSARNEVHDVRFIFVVPEPGSALLAGIALSLLAVRQRRKLSRSICG